jgi:hypothetical protein
MMKQLPNTVRPILQTGVTTLSQRSLAGISTFQQYNNTQGARGRHYLRVLKRQICGKRDWDQFRRSVCQL